MFHFQFQAYLPVTGCSATLGMPLLWSLLVQSVNFPPSSIVFAVNLAKPKAVRMNSGLGFLISLQDHVDGGGELEKQSPVVDGGSESEK